MKVNVFDESIHIVIIITLFITAIFSQPKYRQKIFLLISWATFSNSIIIPCLKKLTNQKRPICKDRTKYGVTCLGMPSSHSFFITTVMVYMSLLYPSKTTYILSIIIILFISSKRIKHKLHSQSQVLAGILIGFVFGYIGFKIPPTKTNIAILLSITGICALYYARQSLREIKIFDEMYKKYPIPSYLSDISINSLNKKIQLDNRDYYIPTCILSNISGADTHKYTWKDIEDYLDKFINKVNIKKYDKIIGILSGGAYLADYITVKTGIPIGYIKMNVYGGEKTFIDTVIKAIICHTNKIKVDMTKIKKYNIDDVKDKNLLIVDDCLSSGNTLNNVKQYLLNRGAKSVESYVIFGMDGSKCDHYSLISPAFFMPWGLQS